MAALLRRFSVCAASVAKPARNNAAASPTECGAQFPLTPSSRTAHTPIESEYPVQNISKRNFALVASALALGFAGTAVRAETNDDMSFSGMFKADRLDAIKDGMISKAEFMAMMDKAWDMKSKEMKVSGDKMTMQQMAAFNQWLSRGEKNK